MSGYDKKNCEGAQGVQLRHVIRCAPRGTCDTCRNACVPQPILWSAESAFRGTANMPWQEGIGACVADTSRGAGREDDVFLGRTYKIVLLNDRGDPDLGNQR